MKKGTIVHTGTLIQVNFSMSDGKGNVIPQTPLQLRSDEFDGPAFASAFETLLAERDKQWPKE